MLSHIFIDGLTCKAKHGCLAFEKNNPQIFTISIKVYYDAFKAMEKDLLEHAVCYESLSRLIVKVLEKPPVNLIEHLAFIINKKIFDSFAQVKVINLRIEKPNAPINVSFKTLGFQLNMDRKDF